MKDFFVTTVALLSPLEMANYSRLFDKDRDRTNSTVNSEIEFFIRSGNSIILVTIKIYFPYTCTMRSPLLHICVKRFRQCGLRYLTNIG